MKQLFRDRLREVHAFVDLAALWGRTLADWAVSLPASYWVTPDALFSSLADPARRRIFFACCEAGSFSRREVAVEHLLLAVLRQEPGLVPGVALETMVRTIETKEPAGRRFPPNLDPHAHPSRFPSGAPVELSEEAIRVVAAATEIAHTARGDRRWRRQIWRQEFCAKRTLLRPVYCVSTFPIGFELAPSSVGHLAGDATHSSFETIVTEAIRSHA
jgi:hypothetical protein